MRELIIKIAMENAAFGNSRYEEMREATRILNEIIGKMVMREKICDDIAMDSNGNCVASVEVVEQPVRK